MNKNVFRVAAAFVLASAPALWAESTLANGTTANISNRARSGPGDEASISAFVIKDAAAFVLIRAVGPGLAPFSVTNYATTPSFEVFDGKGAVVTRGVALSALSTSERDTASALFRNLGAFPLPPASADSFAYLCLNPGSYTIVARSGANPGIILTEVYFDPAALGARVPTSFDSTAAASLYAASQFASGKTETVRVGNEDILILHVYGSGVPELALATYRRGGDRWKLASEWKPQKPQFYSVKESNGEVVATGNTTGEEWLLLHL